MQTLRRLAGMALVLAWTIGLGACNTNPTAPSGEAGATISGTVSSPVPPDLRVSAGAGSGVLVSPSGTFTLTKVEPGSTELRFTTGGTTASLPLSAVRSQETVTVTVSLSGASAVLESLRRVHGVDEQVEGPIQSLEPGLMLVAGRSIALNAGTQFRAGGQPASEAALATGQRVDVKGKTNGASLLASLVEIFSVIPVIPPPVIFTGRIIDKTGSAPELVLTVAPKTVLITAATIVRRKGELQNAGTIAIGQTVEVAGIVQPDGTITATSLNITLDSAGGEFSMEGTLQGQSGPCPQLQMVVSTYEVSTSASTNFATPCGDLAVGDRIVVVGIVQADLSVVATYVRLK